jgi:hypothetical protein
MAPYVAPPVASIAVRAKLLKLDLMKECKSISGFIGTNPLLIVDS